MSAPAIDRTPPGGRTDLTGRPLGPSRGWAPAWRIAHRDLRRHPGRTAAAIVMILLPVLLASALAVVLATTDVSPREYDLARLASAEAVVVVDPGIGERSWTRAEVEDQVGVPLVEVQRGDVDVVSADGPPVGATALVTDLADPVTTGLVDVLSGRLPAGGDEVAASPGLADALGVQVGERVVVGGLERRVTGLVVERWGDAGARLLVGGPAAVAMTAEPAATTWLAPSAQQVDRSVQSSTDGLVLLVREDVERSYRGGGLGAVGGESLVVLSVGITLVVLEIALLAGPAFAVGVRQQQQTLALLAATGADGRALRRVVLTQALLVGVGAAAPGALLGVALAALSMHTLRYRVGSSIGPVDVPWVVVAGFVVIGVVAAVASALVPALTASRATVVGALGPRTASRRVPWRRPLTGASLLVTGSLLLQAAAAGATESATGASVAVLLLGVGMVLVVPLPVALLGRLTTRLPLGLRLAGRESSRAAGRTTAAVAAVAGASAALVAALTITAGLTEADRTIYRPTALPGVTVVYTESATDDVTALAEQLLPGSRTGVTGGDARFGSGLVDGGEDLYASLLLPTPGCVDWSDPGGACGSEGWVGEGVFGPGFASADVVAATLAGYDLTQDQTDVLQAGGVLLAEGSPATTADGTLEVAASVISSTGTTGTTETRGPTTVPVARWSPTRDQPVVLLSEMAARELGVWFPDRVLVQPAEQVAAPLTTADLEGAPAREAAVDAVAPLHRAVEADRSLRASVATEVGYRSRFVWVDTVVVVAALVVLLGATFTATALALSDARRDRVVLTAAGATPASQRMMSGGTATLIAATGALVGILSGLVPGVVVARAVLSPGVASYGLGVTDGIRQSSVAVLQLVPWGWLVTVLVGLPLLAGLVVAAVAPGRPDSEVARSSWRAR